MHYKILQFLFNIFSSIWLTIGAFIALFFICILGTLFPQGVSIDEYRSAGPKFLFLVENLGVLDIFHSKFIVFVSSLLFFNLILCNLKRATKGWKVNRTLSVVYHILIACILVLFYVSSKRHEAREIALKKGEERILEFDGNSFSLLLEGFEIDYIEALEYNLKRSPFERLKIILSGLNNNKLPGEEAIQRFYRDFMANIKVTYNGKTIRYPLGVNNSLVFNGYSLNLFGYEHEIVLKFGETSIIAKSDTPFSAPDGSLYKVSEVIDGNLLMINGSEIKLLPEIKIYKKINDGWVMQGVISMGKSISIDKELIEFSDYSYKVYLGAKFDPAVRYLKIFSFFSIIILFSVIIMKIK